MRADVPFIDSPVQNPALLTSPLAINTATSRRATSCGRPGWA